ncbi:MaoC/PaaZ C-terminal domain-containing protein [Variovorax sp. J22R133]|uniref:MaoC/PaaZ C-terminal domain-containing protein n=1 Tax=Variovorax brevis TaxID=3053503 RepID=UPI00257906EF|nr:MaoC/PaaZ C-terminal domain-containing protein [Variovorax sp. J22R133]MDM0111397.1 MaoC/PaaZ C-terminal domain-containing protein [Variovorax sp. J22R133]
MNTENRYLEDLALGERWVSEAVTLTEDDITRFGRDYDPQPMHTDRESAARGPFGGIIASGWHLTALVMRLSVTSRSFGGTPIIGAGADELRWLQPVRPDDTLTLDRVIEQIDPPARPGGRGTVRTRMTLRNQRDEKVMTMVAIGKIPVRPS